MPRARSAPGERRSRAGRRGDAGGDGAVYPDRVAPPSSPACTSRLARRCRAAVAVPVADRARARVAAVGAVADGARGRAVRMVLGARGRRPQGGLPRRPPVGRQRDRRAAAASRRRPRVGPRRPDRGFPAGRGDEGPPDPQAPRRPPPRGPARRGRRRAARSGRHRRALGSPTRSRCRAVARGGALRPHAGRPLLRRRAT
jgi:hypothetical protein